MGGSSPDPPQCTPRVVRPTIAAIDGGDDDGYQQSPYDAVHESLSRIIQVTDNLRLGIFAATGGIMLVYLVNFVMSFFGTGIPMIHGSGMMGIGFSLLVVGIAAMNLVLDFDFIERGAEAGAPKYM